MTISRALVTLAEQGAAAETAERARLAAAYEQFMSTEDPVRKNAVGRELILVNLPPPLLQHILDRVAERAISLDDLQRLRSWGNTEARPP